MAAVVAGCANGGRADDTRSAEATGAPRAAGASVDPMLADTVVVTIDGRFNDWQWASARALEGFQEVRAVSTKADAHAVYSLFELGEVGNLQGRPAPLLLVFDSDRRESTGVEAFGLPGADLVVSMSWLGPDGGLNQGIAAWEPAQDEPDRTRAPRGAMPPADIGLWYEPRNSADVVELRLARSAGGHFAAGTFRARVVSLDAEAAEIARSPVFEADAPAGSPDRSAVWPRVGVEALSRAPGTGLRVVVWNVARRLARNADPARRVLAALDPDVVLLDEVSPGVSSVALRAILPDGGPEWSVHVGTSGRTQRGAIAARGIVTPAAPFDTLAYLEPGADPSSEFGAMRLEAGVPAAGAVVDAAGVVFLAVAIDLECCGNSAASPQERLRILEARAINRGAHASLSAAGEPLPVLIGGDFNLVGSAEPLSATGAGLAPDGGDLVDVYALQLDGASSATWVGPGTPFPPGQLDYLLYPPGVLDPLSAFVFETDDLTPGALEALGLSAEDSDAASDHRPLVIDFRSRR